MGSERQGRGWMAFRRATRPSARMQDSATGSAARRRPGDMHNRQICVQEREAPSIDWPWYGSKIATTPTPDPIVGRPACRESRVSSSRSASGTTATSEPAPNRTLASVFLLAALHNQPFALVPFSSGDRPPSPGSNTHKTDAERPRGSWRLVDPSGLVSLGDESPRSVCSPLWLQ